MYSTGSVSLQQTPSSTHSQRTNHSAGEQRFDQGAGLVGPQCVFVNVREGVAEQQQVAVLKVSTYLALKPTSGHKQNHLELSRTT